MYLEVVFFHSTGMSFLGEFALVLVPVVVLGLVVCLSRMWRMPCILFGFPPLVVCSYTGTLHPLKQE